MIALRHMIGGMACLAVLFAPLLARAQVALPEDHQSAVIFVYHKVGEDEDPSVSIRAEQFEDHIRELQRGDYNIVPLSTIVDALKMVKPLPPRTVAITFDGGYRTILASAVPLLLSDNIPFTIFFSPGQLDQHLPDYISWDDVKRLSGNKLVTFGIHTSDYTRLAGAAETEIQRQVNSAGSRFREKLGYNATLFAYPFGEYSLPYRDVLIKSGFTAGFGQQSGAAWPGADLYALPRFSMTESYGGLDRFRMAADALPLPVKDVVPKDPHLDAAQPAIGFTVDPGLKNQLGSLSCFVPGQTQPQMHLIGTRVELRLARAFDDPRARVNCTMPVPMAPGDDTQRYRWFSLLLTAPVPDQGQDSDDDTQPDAAGMPPATADPTPE